MVQKKLLFPKNKSTGGKTLRKSALWLLLILAVVLGAATTAGAQEKPNILVIMGDDVGYWNLSYNSGAMMGYKTTNIDRIAAEGMRFTDDYGEQSCTAGRAAFTTGQMPVRTGMTKVGLPGADLGIRKEDPTLAELLKPLGYATGQFGKPPGATRTSSCPRPTALTSSSATSTTSTPKRPQKIRFIPKIRSSERNSGPRGEKIHGRR